MLVYALLASNNWDEERTEDCMETLTTYLTRPVSNAVVMPFYKQSTDGVLAPCTVLLEDGRGGVARDVQGHPLCCTFGVAPPLTMKEMINVAVWSAHRVARFTGDNELPQTTNIIDMLHRGNRDAGKSLPMPEAQMIELSALLPNSNTRTYVCGARSEVKAAFDAMSHVPLLRRWCTNFVFCDDYSCLSGVIPLEHMLPWWADGAAFDFNVDAYRQHLAAEE
tara:strand:+ start:891 stop:1556 length:666 start_codon:yes stop_codon:yes gene_type:complete